MDDYVDTICENDFQPVWITKDKREIPIKKLDTNHLSNIIKMLLRSAAMVKAKTTITHLDGPGMLGDAATDCFQQEFSMILDSEVMDYVPDIFKVLWEEWEIRKNGQEDLFEATYGMELYLKKANLASVGLELKVLLKDKS